tara:strand:- start:6418 stop:6519 length:102 start_codon:yes stop_codon:yes gene_type:complete
MEKTSEAKKEMLEWKSISRRKVEKEWSQEKSSS